MKTLKQAIKETKNFIKNTREQLEQNLDAIFSLFEIDTRDYVTITKRCRMVIMPMHKDIVIHEQYYVDDILILELKIKETLTAEFSISNLPKGKIN